MKRTPLQEVKERFGSKEELVEALAPLLVRPEGESEAEHQARLLTVPNKKLLHLHQVQSETKKRFGSRETLVDAICKLKFGDKNIDQDYRTKLLTLSNASLLDRYRALSRG
ncbi:MAG: hypothetical protein FJ125_14425 [Deltaproteobacteria bacterium]|nr:hypothetical protein [Deltaproteobacteria bacterium]